MPVISESFRTDLRIIVSDLGNVSSADYRRSSAMRPLTQQCSDALNSANIEFLEHNSTHVVVLRVLIRTVWWSWLTGPSPWSPGRDPWASLASLRLNVPARMIPLENEIILQADNLPINVNVILCVDVVPIFDEVHQFLPLKWIPADTVTSGANLRVTLDQQMTCCKFRSVPFH